MATEGPLTARRRTDPALRLEPQEERIAYALAAASTVAFTVIWTPWQGDERLVLFLFALAFAAALAVVARQRHRLWTAFSAFLTGLFAPWGFAYILGAALIAFAFWLVWRAHRSAKAALHEVAEATWATPVPAKRTKAVESGRVTPKGTARRRSPKRTARTR